MEDGRCLRQLDKEGGLTSEDAVTGADAGVDAVDRGHFAVVGRDFAAHLREDGDETGLA